MLRRSGTTFICSSPRVTRATCGNGSGKIQGIGTVDAEGKLDRPSSCFANRYRSRRRRRHVVMDLAGNEGAAAGANIGHANADLSPPSKLTHHGHDTHAIPPQDLCNLYKKYQRMTDAAVNQDPEIVDFSRGLTDRQKERLVPADVVSEHVIREAWSAFVGARAEDVARGTDRGEMDGSGIERCIVYEHRDFHGLRIFPALLPPKVQRTLVSRLLHRDLAHPAHKTNLHGTHSIPYPPLGRSFFSLPQVSPTHSFVPLTTTPIPTERNTDTSNNSKDSTTPTPPKQTQKPLNMAQFLQKKLRWLTLGEQYDWDTRGYRSNEKDASPDADKTEDHGRRSPTPFPPDIKALVTHLFHDAFVPESGVVLLYSTRDYMPVHRDVSEECARGLASISLGCDGLFIISRDRGQKVNNEGNPDPDGYVDTADRIPSELRPQEMVVLRVRSGDVVQLSGETRWAWHAMPKVMAGTAPEWAETWPVVVDGGDGPRKGEQEQEADDDCSGYEVWRGFMRGKRLNISCRQVWA